MNSLNPISQPARITVQQSSVFPSWLLVIVNFAFMLAPIVNADNWQNCTSIEDVWAQFPDQSKAVLAAINPNYPGLENVKAGIENEDYPAALSALVRYYRESSGWKAFFEGESTRFNREKADLALKDVYTFQNVTDTIPRASDGSLEWGHKGPHNDEEFGFFLNRHADWINLLNTFNATGNVKYAKHLDLLIRDWAIHNPKPNDNVRTVQWRVLEVGIRMIDVWPMVFNRFIESDEMSPATVILMLGAFADQADYDSKYHWRHHNHASMEMLGLAHTALAFPQFESSENWYRYAKEVMLSEMDYQFYPDGVQNELTSHYHTVSLRKFDTFAQISEFGGKPVDEAFNRTREMAWNYIAKTVRPSGRGLLNNDSDLDYNVPEIMKMSTEFKRPDWTYIATHGAEGEKPDGPPSVAFRWPGQLISRSGWDADAHWSFFDAGPWGTSHQHSDKLHLSISAYGRDLLVDSGRFRYIQDAWRNDYILHSRSHNVILIDGQGQKTDVETLEEPVSDIYIHPEFDFGIQDTGTLIPGGKHTRAVLYIRGKYWLVFDYIQSSGEHTISPLWHFHPDCTVTLEGTYARTTDREKGNIRIHPITTMDWDVNIVKGQESPEIQGWYSVEYNKITPSPCAVYQTRIKGSQAFAWLIQPARGKVPEAMVQLISEDAQDFHLTVDDGTPIEIVINLTNAEGVDGRCLILGLSQEPLLVPKL